MNGHLPLNGQVAVVTGAGNGLGRSHALLLARLGASVVVNDLGADVSGLGSCSSAADAVAAEINAFGGAAIPNHDTVERPDAARAIIEAAIGAFGAIDILVCNAGMLISEPFETLTDETWDRMLAVHVGGTMYPARAAWPHMQAKGYGRLVFTSSSGGIYGKAGLAAYSAAKGAVYGLMRALADEGAGFDLCVNTILPSADTRLVPAGAGALWSHRPEMASAALVSALVGYLAGPTCHDTGQLYAAGGGLFARSQIVQARGHRFHDAGDVTAEAIEAHWAEINDLTDARVFGTLGDHSRHYYEFDD